VPKPDPAECPLAPLPSKKIAPRTDLLLGTTKRALLRQYLLSERGSALLIGVGLKRVAGILGVSSRTLRRSLEEAGLRPAEHVRRLRRAAVLRGLSGNGPMKNVASTSGFASQQSMAHFVRREFNMAAGALRLLLRWHLLRDN
jgi:AraC-like DNA-binding protein